MFLLKNHTSFYKFFVVGMFLAVMASISGCGKKGAPEAPVRADEVKGKDGERKKEDAKRPVTIPKKSFILDPLL